MYLYLGIRKEVFEMSEQDKQELLEIADVAYKAFALTLETSNIKEQEFICENKDIFLCVFNRAVLITKRLLENKN